MTKTYNKYKVELQVLTYIDTDLEYYTDIRIQERRHKKQQYSIQVLKLQLRQWEQSSSRPHIHTKEVMVQFSF